MNDFTHVVAEYVDEAEVPTDVAFHRGEAVRTRLAATFVDQWWHKTATFDALGDAPTENERKP